MPIHASWSCVAIFFALSITANTQNRPAATPITKYDGTYAFASQTKVNELS
jgi:hypothetical protein